MSQYLSLTGLAGESTNCHGEKTGPEELEQVRPQSPALETAVPPRSLKEDRLIAIWQAVLRRSNIGVHDDFLDLGGDSFLAAQAIVRIAQEFKVAVPVSRLFLTPTIAGLAEWLESSEDQIGMSDFSPLLRLPRPEPLPLGYAQQGMWFMAQMEGGSRPYHIPFGFHLRGALDVPALRRALNGIIARHEALRTTFVLVDGQPTQQIAPANGSRFWLIEQDLRGNADSESQLLRLAEEEAAALFSLDVGPLIRGRLIQTGEQQYALLITMHHIISDGWSMGIFVDELSSFYRAHVQGEQNRLPELDLQYADYVVWQRHSSKDGILQQQSEYWKSALAGAPAVLELPTDHARPAQQDYAGQFVEFGLDEELTEGLEELSRRHGTTVFMTVLAGWAMLLGRLSGQEDVVIGAPTANRGRSEIENLIGCFINTLALRVDLSGEPTVAELLARVKEQTLAAQQHENLPFEQVVELLQPTRSLAHSPLFQVMFAWHNEPEAKLRGPDLEVEALRWKRVTTKFDLTLSLRPEGRKITGGVTYATALFKRSTIQRYLGYLRTILQHLVEGTGQSIARMSLLSEHEQRQLLQAWNDTAVEYPDQQCLHQIFEAQALRSPQQLAVVYESSGYTYDELNRRANQLAGCLRDLGMSSETLVALCVGRGLEMIVAVLAVWKAGGGYVPLDPEYPDQRLRYMVEDSGAGIVLTEEKLAERMRAVVGEQVRVVVLDGEREQIRRRVEELKAGGVELEREVRPGHLAYVIYTSGSTGQPKGVQISHRSVVNLYFALRERVYGGSRQEGMRVAMNGPLTFDTSVKQIVQLLGGHELEIIPEEVRRDGEALLEYVRKRKIEVLDCTPSQLRLLLEAGLEEEEEGAVAGHHHPGVVLVGGEAIEEGLWKRLGESKIRFFNVYGPTECTVDATVGEIGRESVPTIGRPIANTRIYILDAYRNPQPVGVAGELYIAGEGVARGYRNRPELTAEKFVADPFAGGRMYRTGDRGRWLEDGTIQYLGRMDTQVKLRGYRIELGEIEQRLRQHAEIEDSVVVVQGEEGREQLVAYYRAKRTNGEKLEEVEAEQLRRHVAERLPGYMVPVGYVSLREMPLTANGKVDRRRLSGMEVKIERGEQYVGPRNRRERELVELWAEVLQLDAEKVGVKDNFFEIGGHSLLATQVMAKVRSRLGIEVGLKELFEHPRVEELAERLEEAGKSAVPAMVAVERGQAGEGLPLSYAQERLWFIQQLEPESVAYNLPAAVRIEGELKVEELEEALNRIIARHESLRTVFPNREGEARQVILEGMEMRLGREDVSGYGEEEQREREAQAICQREAGKVFDLGRGPLIRGVVIKLGEQEHVLLLTQHHIVSDGWSQGVLFGELGKILEAKREGREAELKPLPIQYADYSVWQRRWLEQGEVLEEQLKYWEQKLEGMAKSLDLATDYGRGSEASGGGASEEFVLEAGLTERLRRLGEEQGGTLYMVLLAAFQALLYRYTGQEDICVGSPIANRQYGESEGLIGMFVNTLAMRSRVEGEERFRGFLRQVRKTCLEAYEHQDAPFEKVVERVQPERDLAISPIFQVMLVLQNAQQEEVEELGVGFKRYRLQRDISKFDVVVGLRESGGELRGTIRYRSGLYKRETMERMARHYEALCRAIVAEPERRICELEYLSKGERERLLEEFNDTGAEYGKERCIHELFVEQAKRHGGEVAVVCGEQELSYEELEERSEELGMYLQGEGVGPERVVGVCLERSVEMVEGLLGILQAGGGYVPLDPEYPDQRLRYMVEDSGAGIVLTEEKLAERMRAVVGEQVRVVVLDGEREQIRRRVEELKAGGVELEREVRPGHLAYVIYTSGSTGQPKGVQIEHHSAATLVHWASTVYSREELAGVLASTSICFDLSVFEIFVTLANGGTVIVVRNALGLLDLTNQESVTLINTVPSAMEELVRLGAIPKSVQTVNLAGEALSPVLVDKIYNRSSVSKVYDLYGPSEDTTYSTCMLRKKNAGQSIGRPIANTRIYILDAYRNPQPVGVAGELYIAGEGVARGYRNRPELTAEKFVADPFAGGRMYRTGDRGRWLEDGTIQYLGRMDTQVKLRGYRIELGEIEQRLRQHAEIEDSVVVVQGEEGREQLVAYYRAKRTNGEKLEEVEAEQLRRHVAERLPGYMVPVGYVSLREMPLTANGKVDRRRLSGMEVKIERGEQYVGPRNRRERELVELWAEVLQLDAEKVGVKDNFFEIGGHSLLATQVMAKVRSRLGIEVGLKELFEHPRVEELAERLEEAGKSAVPAMVAVERGQAGEGLPLSYAQERLWFIQQLEPESVAYNLPAAVRIEGELKVEELEEALNRIIARHESLRTVFPNREGEARQVILEGMEMRLGREDVSGYGEEEQREREAQAICQREAGKVFDLGRGPLIRGVVIKLGEQEHVLLLTQHHIVSDGWSQGVLFGELGKILEAKREGREAELKPLPIQYADYSVWQRRWLEQGEVLEEQLKYWEQKLEGMAKSLDLATDYGRGSEASGGGASEEFVLEAGLTERLRRLGEEQGGTLYMVLLAAFQALLYRYTGQEDICVGSPIANRQYGESEGLIGMFVNTLAMRSRVEGEERFRGFLRQVRKTCLEAYEHQDAPFEKVVERVQPERDLAISPIFQVMLVLQNAQQEEVEELGVGFKRYRLQRDISKFDVVVGLRESGGELRGTIRYRSGLYKRETMERMARHYEALCRAIVAEPERRICELEYLSKGERERLLEEFNDTGAEYGKERCIHELFVEQAKRHGGEVAVVCGEQELSYEELEERSEELGMYLQGEGVGPERVVGVCLERSVEMVEGLLGILQAGGGYVPLDPEYPDQRLRYMVEDSGAGIVLTEEKLAERMRAVVGEQVRVVVLDGEREQIRRRVEELKAGGVELEREVRPGHLAYVIYTSGSTGQPKGVQISHRSVVNLYFALRERVYGGSRQEGMRVAMNGPLTFDTSVKQIVQLLGGHELEIIPEEVRRDGEALLEYVRKRKIEVLDCTPSQLRLLLEAGLEEEEEGAVAGHHHPGVVLVGGEAIEEGLWKRLGESKIRFFNVYGPTECTVDATVGEIGRESVPTIGRPIANTRIYILDAYRNPQPVGVAGELYIAGEGVARGYRNRPELTAEKFVADPFAGGRMYRTGDRGRWLEDGTIQYLGRMDTQVKLRGYRIELGEIEQRLRQHAEIEDSVVVVQGEEGREQLVAYYRAKRTNGEKLEEVEAEQLRRHVAERLPGYMVPVGYVSLREMPLTANGKVDRRRLSGMEVKIERGEQYVGPRNRRERELVELWAEVLQLDAEKVGVKDNFFEIGGHSLLATQVMAKVRSRLGIEVGLKELFEHPRVEELAERLEEAGKSAVPAMVAVERGQAGEGLPLSYAQERLWFIQQLEPESVAYNLPAAVRIEGELKVEELEEALNRIIARHESLRTVFPNREGEARQVILEGMEMRLGREDVSGYGEEEQREREAQAICQREAGKVFDLGRGPLIRGVVIKLGEQEHVLLLTQHHIVSDGWSQGVLFGELGKILEAKREGREAELKPLPIQYADYSVWQRRWLEQGEVLEEQLKYWEQKLEGMAKSLDLATDYGRGSEASGGGASEEFVLEAGLTERLRRLGEEQGGTLYMVLLAAFQALLYRYTGQEDICVGSPIANRQYGESEGLIGMFVNTLAMRSRVEGEERFRGFLRQVRKTCLEAYEHQDAPFEKVVERVQPERDLAISPIFQVMLVLQNAQQEEVEELGVGFKRYRLQRDISKFDVVVGLRESGGELRGTIRYRSGLYKRETMERMARHYEALCRAIVAEPERRICELEYLSKGERERLLEEFNDTGAEYGKERCIHELFVEQAKRHGGEVAVVCGEQELSYEELEERSEELGMYLQGEGVGPERVVGVCLERSVEMVEGLLGILQAGGGYVPLDPEYPDQRLRYMVEDSGAGIVLTEEKLAERMRAVVGEQVRVVVLDGEREQIRRRVEELKAGGVELEREVRPGHLAYVIYTSGSTGQPKGVQIEHHSAATLVHWASTVYSREELAGVLASTSICFDLSVFEIFVTLANGGTVIVVRNALGLLDLTNQESVTLINTVPSAMEELVRLGAIPKSVQTVNLAGEALSPVLVDKIYNRSSVSKVYDLYGPSEDTTYSTCMLRKKNAGQSIGRPIANTRIYILDAYRNPQPVGVAGELYIAGEGVARGYRNRPELTAEKFVADPFAGGRMYRTGDRGRWLEDGTIQYLGRMDTQVKLRGYRIELGEIEQRLRQHAEIEDSVVVVQGEEGREQLVAYYRAKRTNGEKLEEVEAEQLRRHVAERLPGYMVPVGYVSLREMPLTANGKVDRRRLSGMEVKIERGEQYVGPRNRRERELVELWAEVLQLDAEKVGVKDNFFEIGGHSLLATQVMAKVRSRLGIEVGLKELFEHPRVEELAERLEEAGKSAVPAMVAVERGQAGEGLPLSYAQERLWFIQQLEPESVAYNLPAAVRIEGELKVEELEEALNRIIARHESLRTVFPNREGEARQVILEGMEMRLGREDVSGYGEEEQREREAQAICQREAGKVFDLGRGPLIRGVVIKLGEQEHVLLLTQHHIVSDGWSQGVLFGELGKILEAKREGREAELKPLPIQYADYSVWQRRWLEQGEVLEEQLKYWEQKLEGMAKSLDLATDYGRGSEASGGGASEEFVLEAGLTERLRRLGEEQGGTLYMVLLAAFQALLYRYTGQEDICVGSPIANRQYGESEGLIGMFVNTLAMRSRVEGEERFRGFLRQVRKTCLEAYEHQDAPFEKVVERVQPERDLAISPIFQVMLVLQNAQQEEVEELGVGFKRYRLQRDISKFDVVVGLRESGGELRGTIRYRSGLYKRETMERMARHYEALCRAIVAEPERRICELEYLSKGERERLLEEFNDTGAEYGKERCIHELFVEQAKRHGGEVAVVCGEQELSYEELEERSEELGMYLQGEGVGPERVVGVCLERSVEMVEGLLGILQAGGGYVPLDPEYPDQRLRYMVEDSGAGIVLTEEKLAERMRAVVGEQVRVVVLDGEREQIRRRVEELKAGGVELEREVRPGHLAYVIYTSGSTGQPKGVQIEHHSAATLVHWASTVYSREELAGVLASTSICFDLSVFEIFVTLANGGTVIVVRNALGLLDLTNQESVTLINTVPSAMEELVRLGAIPKSVQTVNLAGEALSPVLVDKIYNRSSVSKVYDLYGPSEDTTYSTCMLRKKNAGQSIGRPIANTRIYILDAYRNPQPVGVAGELYIAGEGVARGYRNRPELTAEKFVADPFAGGRMYRTGDRGRWLEDGTIQYLGRMDTQVKLRGYRIELGEIEQRLRQHNLVREAAVVIDETEPAGKRLVAYVVPTTTSEAIDGSLEENELATTLRSHLTAFLPGYMVPAVFVKLDILPRTPNGKLDRKRLPSPVVANAQRAYEAPVGKTEMVLASIWEEVLKIQKIGRRDSFFERGGHSLLTLRLVNSLERKGINISALDIFKYSTLESLATKVEFEGGHASRDRAISLRSGGSELPLFFTHDGSAQLIYVPALAPYIDADIPLYGLPAIPAYEAQMETIEEMAARMVKMIREVQPAGPYRITGWSFGGLTAYEVAVQLVCAGEKVDFIGLIDTYYPAPKVPQNARPFDEKNELLNGIQKMMQFLPELSESQRLQATAEIDSLAANADFEDVVEKCREMRLLPSRWVDLTAVQLRQTLIRMHSHRVASLRYSASWISVPLHLFHACNDESPLSLGWNIAFPESQIRVIQVPGTHLTIMEKPNVATLGQALSDAIRHATCGLGGMLTNQPVPETNSK